MSEVTLGELYFGAANSGRKEYNFARIALFKKAVVPIPIDEDIWRLFGNTKAMLRKQGKAISDLDLLVACTAKVCGLVLVTNDRDFDVLPDAFQKENWV
ncbi:PIN domain-containing protein [Desulfonema magnum]|uniref:PIN domain-containing protein n=2 Tax=Desulfonema magnum TaxID=45655 RepID=A0A975BJC8_9BACT|nr:PIN domain-containing protein [Desulfonema magnum]